MEREGEVKISRKGNILPVRQEDREGISRSRRVPQCRSLKHENFLGSEPLRPRVS